MTPNTSIMNRWNHLPLRTASVRSTKNKFSSTTAYNNHLKKEKFLSNHRKKGVQILATKDLLKLRSKNNGKAKRGDIKKIVQQYQDEGHYYITKGTMNYSVLKEKQLCTKKLPRTVTFNTVQTESSPLTEDLINTSTVTVTVNATGVDSSFPLRQQDLVEQWNKRKDRVAHGLPIFVMKEKRKKKEEKKIMT